MDSLTSDMRAELWPADMDPRQAARFARQYGDLPNRARLTVPEVAERLRCDRKHVLNLLDDGTLEGVDVARAGAARSEWRVLRSSVVAFLEARGTQRR